VRVEGKRIGREGCLYIVSGPSGAGKTSIAAPVLAAMDDVEMSVSLTTRARRPGEVDGLAYHFVSEGEFDARVAANALAEWAVVHGFRYGTERATIDRILDGGRDVLLDIDVQGAAQIKLAYPGAVSVFLLPPSREHLQERLRGRGTDDAATVERRLEGACREIEAMTDYDYVIVNEHLPSAVEQFLWVVRSERLKVSRMRDEEVARVLASFRIAR
jgi:guanylate kinase